jgi:hypothetical protein
MEKRNSRGGAEPQRGKKAITIASLGWKRTDAYGILAT